MPPFSIKFTILHRSEALYIKASKRGHRLSVSMVPRRSNAEVTRESPKAEERGKE